MTLSGIGVLLLWGILLTHLTVIAINPKARTALCGIWQTLWQGLWWFISDWRSHPKERTEIGESIEILLSCLVRSGFRSAEVWVHHKSSRRRIHFKKYIREPGDYGIELVFTKHKWASDYFVQLQTYCEHNEIPYRIRPRRTPRAWAVLFVDCERDVALAVKLVRYVWAEIFNLPEDEPREVGCHSISPFGEVVDRPDQGYMSIMSGLQHILISAHLCFVKTSSIP